MVYLVMLMAVIVVFFPVFVSRNWLGLSVFSYVYEDGVEKDAAKVKEFTNKLFHVLVVLFFLPLGFILYPFRNTRLVKRVVGSSDAIHAFIDRELQDSLNLEFDFDHIDLIPDMSGVADYDAVRTHVRERQCNVATPSQLFFLCDLDDSFDYTPWWDTDEGGEDEDEELYGMALRTRDVEKVYWDLDYPNFNSKQKSSWKHRRGGIKI